MVLTTIYSAISDGVILTFTLPLLAHRPHPQILAPGKGNAYFWEEKRFGGARRRVF